MCGVQALKWQNNDLSCKNTKKLPLHHIAATNEQADFIAFISYRQQKTASLLSSLIRTKWL